MSSHPPIRSYVLRQGYFSSAQRHAYESLLPRYGIPFSENPIDLNLAFGRITPKILEIGSGMGETTAEIAGQHPEKDFVAIEVHAPGIGNLLGQIEKHGLTNLRIIPHDAKPVLQHMFTDESLDGIHIFFPDPWPKTRHHKRRLIQSDFVSLLCSRLKPGGYLHIATDWEDYATHILHVLHNEPRLINTTADYASRPPYRPLTKFEQRGMKLGHTIRDLIFSKTA
ncbi:tRNA (guanosine(46)-N7)-methyltransferase TrmB [Nitrosomonas sp. HPC101]|uniref:tRNA (guanosine(46)-N7)-methyltransferase TrmB n=1 Tax=Nitrosomonas sp. HPC101 TaxID=1658667 RepID=UPI00136D6696|nr:tRNA (guanosine(46)-N7)-methyltransferase TrmB [Nitrosomonas sp. HPC101]MXS86065.1 tRNA (guanosine(46)-N7)-methyltransferase TrmB [Nitrosomonas sp. HPC101]